MGDKPITTYWWLSFTSLEKPNRGQFLGGVFAEGRHCIHGKMNAIITAMANGAYPSGATRIKAGPIRPGQDIPAEALNKLLSEEDLKKLGFTPTAWEEESRDVGYLN